MMPYSFWNIVPIFLLPFLAFVVNAFWGRKLPRQGDWLSVAASFGSFLFSLRIFNDFVFNKYSVDSYIHKYFNWMDMSFGDQIIQMNMGIYIDNMTAIMLLMVSAVATLIHLFSTWYMHGDERYGTFFVYLSLFTSSMLGLVLSDNLLSVFIFWELMGFCSYSLIGFYYKKDKAAEASLKAFMTTRIGDVIFLLGLLAIWSVVGSVNYVDIYSAISQGSFAGKQVIGVSTATFAAFCIFCGTIGKSAQFPLQFWLPDAMMGPTPCSALIHAATMVAAGVYLSLRMYPIIEVGELTTFVAYVGGITALFAASIAVVQSDIKAVLAYSTISQLGFMVLGIGVGSYNAAFMHLITHAVFKACLFLSAGSVIHAVHTQEMPEMGGLRKKLPITFVAMLCCTMAIAGIPFFSGFVSKDRILGDALYWAIHGKESLTAVLPMLMGFTAALLTAFYMFRMIFLTFFGTPRDKEVYDHCHHEHFSFNGSLPLIILTFFTLGFFYCGSITGQGFGKLFDSKYEWFKVLVEAPKTEKFIGREKTHITEDSKEMSFAVSSYQNQSGYNGPNYNEDHLHHSHLYSAIISIILAVLGVFVAFLLYVKRAINPDMIAVKYARIGLLLKNRYYYDEFAIDNALKANRGIYKSAKWFDNVIIDTFLVDGLAVLTKLSNLGLRFIQSGKIQTYFVVMILVIAVYVYKIL